MIKSILLHGGCQNVCNDDVYIILSVNFTIYKKYIKGTYKSDAKNLFFNFINIYFTNCSTYKIIEMEKGQVVEEYYTPPIYSGTDIFIFDILLDPLFLIPGIIIPFPNIESSEGSVIGGSSIPIYIKRTFLFGGRILPHANTGIVYVFSTESGTNYPWITFTDRKGNQITLMNKNFKIEKKMTLSPTMPKFLLSE